MPTIPRVINMKVEIDCTPDGWRGMTGQGILEIALYLMWRYKVATIRLSPDRLSVEVHPTEDSSIRSLEDLGKELREATSSAFREEREAYLKREAYRQDEIICGPRPVLFSLPEALSWCPHCKGFLQGPHGHFEGRLCGTCHTETKGVTTFVVPE